MSLIEMGKFHLGAMGVSNAAQLSRTEVARLMMSRHYLADRYPTVIGLTMSTSDFANILANTMRKTLRQAYEEVPQTWEKWARRTTNPDFKTITRLALSESPDLSVRKEGSEIKFVTLGDAKEIYALAEHASGIQFTRKAIINDDLDAFGRVPRLQGDAAGRLPDDVAYAILTANAALADGVALFHTATHANLAAAGAALSVTTLGAARAAMKKQKGPKSAGRLNLSAKHLIVPAAIETVAEQLIGSIVDPTKSNATPNPFANKLDVIATPQLDDNSATAWYLAAEHNRIDTVEVCFLEGEETPVLSQTTDFDTDSVKFKVVFVVAAKAIDFRGLYKNDGA